MSIQATTWALCDAPVRNPFERLLLIALANNAHEDGTSTWVSQGTLAERALCSKRTVARHLVELEGRGLIRRGDQYLVRHLPGNRRPVVWDLMLSVKGDSASAHDSVADIGAADAGRSEGAGGPETPLGMTPPTPQTGSGMTPVAPLTPSRGDTPDMSPVAGVTENAPRGDTCVIQNVLKPSLLTNHLKRAPYVSSDTEQTARPDPLIYDPNTDPGDPTPHRHGPAINLDGWTIIRGTVGPQWPAPIRTALALEVGQMLRSGVDPDDIRTGLTDWLARPDSGPRLLPHLVADAVKRRTSTPPPTAPRSKAGIWGALADRAEANQRALDAR